MAFCRICLEEDSNGLVSPCECKGTCEHVHLHCLAEWISQDGRTQCEICKTDFKVTIRANKDATRKLYIVMFLFWMIIGYTLSVIDELVLQFIIYPFMHLLILIGSSLMDFKNMPLLLVSTIGFIIIPCCVMMDNILGFTGACASDTRCPFYEESTETMENIILFYISEVFFISVLIMLACFQHKHINNYEHIV